MFCSEVSVQVFCLFFKLDCLFSNSVIFSVALFLLLSLFYIKLVLTALLDYVLPEGMLPFLGNPSASQSGGHFRGPLCVQAASVLQGPRQKQESRR